MASERAKAKEGIKDKSDDDAELTATLTSAHSFQLKLAQEKNRHTEQIQRNDLGILGRAFGGEKSAPTFIAAIAVLFGIIGAGACWYFAAQAGVNSEFWGTQAERSLAFAVASLTFIFGRGSKQ